MTALIVHGCRRVLDWLPLTPLGAIGAGMLIWLFETAGVERNDRIVLAVTTTGLLLIALAQCCVLVAAVWLRFRPQKIAIDSLQAVTGIPLLTGYRIGVVGWIPLLQVELAWEAPLSGMARIAADGGEDVTFHERGEADTIVRRFVVRDVLGLACCNVRRRAAQSIVVRPACGPVSAPALADQRAVGEQLPHPDGKPVGDLIETRRYVPGDPLKLVLWKVYARTGQLLVRSPERTMAPTRKLLAYFVAGAGDEPTAGVARAIVENGSLGGNFVFGADGSTIAACTPREAVAAIVRSVACRALGGSQLAAFLQEGTKQGIASCVLFVPSRPGSWLDTVAAALASFQGDCRAIVGVDETPADQAGSTSLRSLFRIRDPADCPDETVHLVRDRLSGCGVRVNVIHRGHPAAQHI